MTRLVASAVMIALLTAGSVYAGVGAVSGAQLNAIGLSGFQPMTDAQASTVRGKSYTSTASSSSGASVGILSIGTSNYASGYKASAGSSATVSLSILHGLVGISGSASGSAYASGS